MKSIAIFNNKGGVGKTTLSFHLAHALARMGKRVLVIDLDPQCNFSIFALREDTIESVWGDEEAFIEGFANAKHELGAVEFEKFSKKNRSIHFLLKPVEEGVSEIGPLSPPILLANNLYFVPGRLSLHMFEDQLSSRWPSVFVGEPLAIRTATSIKAIAESYAATLDLDIVIYDTSPSLGMLNRVVLSMSDGFVVPCNPDLFSLYGIKNIGRSLSAWRRSFSILSQVLNKNQLALFPQSPVKFLGYTIYRAARYAGQNVWDLATGHYNYAQQIPQTISTSIDAQIRANLAEEVFAAPIGGTSVMHSHQTMAAMSQKYKVPIWLVPDADLSETDRPTVRGNAARYRETLDNYQAFCRDLLDRMMGI